MILLGKNSVDDLSVDDIDSIEYHTISENDAWRVDLLQELIAVRENEGKITGFTSEELDDILNHVCASQDFSYSLSLLFFIRLRLWAGERVSAKNISSKSSTHKTVVTVLESIDMIIVRIYFFYLKLSSVLEKD